MVLGQRLYLCPILLIWRIFGKLQCNNMIPAPDTELIKVDIDSITDLAYKTLLQKQVQFLRKNKDNILKKHINVVYINRKQGRMDIGYIKNATLDFDLLEEKCDEWINKYRKINDKSLEQY